MGIYKILREVGFKESEKGPVVISGLTGVIENFEISQTAFAILPGYLVPEAKPENYDSDTFKNNYVVFKKK